MKKITPQDSLAQSANAVAANIEQLKALFPDACTEGKIDFEILKQLLGSVVDEREEKYGLNWHGKRRSRQLALIPSTGTLRPCPDESVDWDKTRNVMIEGDNLEVLKLLQKSYAGKVKLIYIDPPYNTGSDRVYPDDFKDNIKNYQMLTGQIDSDGRKISSNTEANGRFHTDWLNMIYPRMKLARNLLREDGIVLISIDDHEIDNLRRVCSDVFGEENSVATLIWEKGRKNDAKLFSVGHEYILIFAKSLGYLRESKTLWREEKPGAKEIWEKYLDLRSKYGGDDSQIEADLQTWYASLPKTHPSRKWSRYKRVDTNGPWRDRDISWPGGGGPRYDVPHPTTGKPCKVPERGWIYSTIDEMQRQIRLGLVAFREDHSEPPFRKAHIRPIPSEIEAESEDEDIDTSENESEELATQVRGSYFYKQSQVAVKLLRNLIGAKVFDNPKDHFELAKLFTYVTANDPNAIIVDFFAGSGSTGHAVMDLNQIDGGNRRYMLVQLPEPLDATDKDQKIAANYCRDHGKPQNIAELTKERLRLAGKKIREERPLLKSDVGFRVFKLDSSNIHAWEPNREDIEKTLLGSIDHLKAKRTENDVLCELLLKFGLDLCVPIEQKKIANKTVHSVGAGTLFICLFEKISRDEVEPLGHGIVAWHKQIAPAGNSTIVFRDSAFVDDVAKTNLTAILDQQGLNNVRSI